jgi:hypothetical protein
MKSIRLRHSLEQRQRQLLGDHAVLSARDFLATFKTQLPKVARNPPHTKGGAPLRSLLAIVAHTFPESRGIVNKSVVLQLPIFR